LPKGTNMDTLTLEEAVEILAKKSAKGAPKKGKASAKDTANDDEEAAPKKAKAKSPAKKKPAKKKKAA